MIYANNGIFGAREREEPTDRRQGGRARASYKGASLQGPNALWIPRNRHPDEDLGRRADTLRARARDIERNTWMGSALRTTLADNVVGTGIDPRPVAKFKNGKPFERFNDAVKALWPRMAELLDITRVQSLEMMQRMWLERMVFDGASLFQMLDRPDDPELPVPLQIKCFDVDLLDTSADREPGPGRNEIRRGRELNADERIVAFHVLQPDGTRTLGTKTRRIPAEDVVYWFTRHRPGQTQGCTELAAIIVNVHNLAEYGEAELIANRMTAANPIFIKTPHVKTRMQELINRRIDRFLEEDIPTDEVVAGMINWLLPDEDVVETGKSRPAGNYDGYTRAEKRDIAAAAGTSFETLTGDYSTTHYSASRAVELKDNRHWMNIQTGFAWVTMRPLYRRFVDRAVMLGLLPTTPSQYFGDPETRWRLTQVEWQAMSKPWHAPEEEAKTALIEIALGLKTRDYYCRRFDTTFEEVAEQLAREEDLIRRHKLRGISMPGNLKQAIEEEPEKKPDRKDGKDVDGGNGQRGNGQGLHGRMLV